jgi:hypothetical protein
MKRCAVLVGLTMVTAAVYGQYVPDANQIDISNQINLPKEGLQNPT